jgi:hypothetical protein
MAVRVRVTVPVFVIVGVIVAHSDSIAWNGASRMAPASIAAPSACAADGHTQPNQDASAAAPRSLHEIAARGAGPRRPPAHCGRRRFRLWNAVAIGL